MLWIAVLCAFCAPPAIGLVVSLFQRRPGSTSSIRGFEVIIVETDDKVQQSNRIA
jgi:hypothetical protein